MSIRESIIDIPIEHISNVFGSCDSYVKKIEKTLKVTIVMRDSELKIIGGEGAVERALIVFNKLIELSRRGNSITEQNVDYAIALSMEGNADAITEIDKDVIARTVLGKPIKPKTLGQKHYTDEIRDKMIVFGIGPAGTGKTYLAMAINAGIGLAHNAPAFEDLLLEIEGDHRQRRQNHHHRQAQFPVDRQHRHRAHDKHHRAHDKHHRAPAQVQQTPANRLRQTLDIAGHAAHQIPHRHTVIIGKGQFLQLMESLLTDVKAHAHFDLSAQIQKGKDRSHLYSQNHRIQEDKPVCKIAAEDRRGRG